MTAPALALPVAAAPFAARLRLGFAEGTPAAALHDRAALAGLLARMRAARPAADPRALASLVAKAACGAAIPGPLAAAACGLALDVAPGTARFSLDAAGLPAALVLPAPRAIDEDAFLAGLFGGLIAPLVETLAAVSGVSQRVLWSNAGNVAAWTLGTLLQVEEPPPRAAALYRELHGRERISWRAGRNPLHRPVLWRLRETAGRTPLVHRRRVCCLRDRAGETLCWSCPRLAPALTPRGCPP
jgi:ferric iron reductase protein FhuF